MKKWYVLVLVSLTLALILGACGSAEKEATEEAAEAVERLQLIKDRGKVIVGCNAELPGFGYINPSGDFEGFDVDFGKAIAAAIFGDADKVEFRPLTAAERLPALQTGEIL